VFAALVIGTIGVNLAQESGRLSGTLAYVWGITISTALVLSVLWGLYTLLLNIRIRWRETLPGAIFAAVLLQASFQILPLFVRATDGLVTLQAFGGMLVLLIWIYVMANVVVLGAEVNWHFAHGRKRPDDPPQGLA
jgi:membrane protein